MSNGANDSRQYSLEDIRNYFLGKMSSAEMHALEKAALDDPFLADAMEGVEAGIDKDPDAFRADISDLRQKLDQRTRRKSFAVRWKVAAAVAAVATSVGIATFFFNQPSANKTVATVEQRSVTPSPPQKESEKTDMADSIIPGPATDVAKNVPPEQRSRQKSSKLNAASDAVIDSSESFYSKPAFDQDTIKQDAYELAKQAPEPALNKEEEVARALSGKAAGVTIDSGAAALNEVVVVGYGVKKNRVNAYGSVRSRNQKNIVPEGGWAKFDQYIQDNKRITGKDTLLTGSEVIVFTIDENGRSVDLKIRSSVSGQHDAEAIRLLQNGPSWRVLKGNRRKVKLTIIF